MTDLCEYLGWNERCEDLYHEFTETHNHEIADGLLHILDAAQRENRWTLRKFLISVYLVGKHGPYLAIWEAVNVN